MVLVYLVTVILGVAIQNILKKSYTQKTHGQGIYVFSLITSFSALVFFAFSSKNIQFDSGLIKYALFFALSYAISQVCITESVFCGSLSLTSLFVSYSLMIPTFYGFIFLKDSVGMWFIPGIALLCLSLYLTNKKNGETAITLKWIVYVLLGTIGNGMCSVVQKMQQLKYEGLYKNEFMIISLAIVTVILALFVFYKERNNTQTFFKDGWKSGLISGIANGMVNLFVMILSNLMPVSLMFPLISVGGLVITYFVSKCYYHENLSKMQTIGLFIGMCSVVLFNI